MLRISMWLTITILLGTAGCPTHAQKITAGWVSAQDQNDQGGGLGRTRGQQNDDDEQSGQGGDERKDSPPPKKPRKDKRDD